MMSLLCNHVLVCVIHQISDQIGVMELNVIFNIFFKIILIFFFLIYLNSMISRCTSWFANMLSPCKKIYTFFYTSLMMTGTAYASFIYHLVET